MALTKCTVKVTNISELATTPNATDGLTDATFKALFDKSPLDFKTYINNVLTVEIEALITAQKLLDNPIGHIIMNVSGTNPSTYIGGTWVAWGTGRVPVGVDVAQTEFATVELESGSKTQILTVENMPKHKIEIPIGSNPQANITAGKASRSFDGGFPGTMYSEEIGGDVAHNNLQPSITCYMFKRTA